MRALFIMLLLCGAGYCALAQSNNTDSLMLTIVLKHQEDKNLDSIQRKLSENHFWKMFPPKSTRVISWYVMMGKGQVVTLKLPAGELRNVNLSIEKGAWGAFTTEFYPTYDYKPIWEKDFKQQQQ